MTTVFLAEKPSQARDIATVLGIKRRHDGYLELNSGDFVTWAVGHLLELASPEAHNPAWAGRWSWAQLPMIPETWKYEVVGRTKAQFKIIQGLLKKASRVVIATDAGREGELIAREILEHCKWKGAVERLWTSSLVAADIKRALSALKPGSETYPLYESALARQRSDNMYGLSGTRAASLAAAVPRDYFPLGRVQTPTLAMVARRDRDIQGFASKTYYELEARVQTRSGHVLTMLHAPEEEQRITDKTEAERRKRLALKAQGPLRVEKSKGNDAAPLPYSLPALQKDANSVFSFSARNTLKLAQALYEKKALTYPRTDCQFLAESQKAEVDGVLAVIAKRFGPAVAELRSKGIHKRSRTFDDSKLTDHHGIIPTSEYVELEGAELQLYTLVCQRYLQVLAADCAFEATKVTMDANGVPFKATGRVVLDPGWTAFKLV